MPSDSRCNCTAHAIPCLLIRSCPLCPRLSFLSALVLLVRSAGEVLELISENFASPEGHAEWLFARKLDDEMGAIGRIPSDIGHAFCRYREEKKGVGWWGIGVSSATWEGKNTREYADSLRRAPSAHRGHQVRSVAAADPGRRGANKPRRH